MTAPTSQAPRDSDEAAPLEPMLTAGDVANFLGVPINTLYAWRGAGDGPKAHRFGKHLRFHRDDLIAFVASKRER